MRQGVCAIVAVLALVVAGCGGGAKGRGSLDTPLSYMPASGGAVAVVSTDVDDARYDKLKNRPDLGFGSEGIEGLLKRTVEGDEVSWEDDVKPALGNIAAIGVEDVRSILPAGVRPAAARNRELFALELRDTGKARTVLDKVLHLERMGEVAGADAYGPRGASGALAAIDGSVLVVAASRDVLERAIVRHRGGPHLTAATFEAATREVGPRDALLRAYADPKALLGVPRLRPLLAVKWIRALRSAGLSVNLDGKTVDLRAALNTEPAALRTRDLPLAVRTETPPLVERAGHVAGASANQSQTTAFMLTAVRQAFPRSAFVRHVAAAERDLDIDFEQEFLRQFDGPSASSIASDARFAARSAVRDPKRMAATIKRLAPRLPQLVADLQALQSKGLATLLLFAPDAPVSARKFSAGGLTLRPLPSGLYEISGLRGLTEPPGVSIYPPRPDRAVFGLIGKVFVVASDEGRARWIARAPAKPPQGVSGASVLKGKLTDLPFLPPQLNPSGANVATGSLDATRSRLLGRLRFPLGDE